eukprot:6378719-Alexandrium_andersonii.AAC.1
MAQIRQTRAPREPGQAVRSSASWSFREYAACLQCRGPLAARCKRLKRCKRASSSFLRSLSAATTPGPEALFG